MTLSNNGGRLSDEEQQKLWNHIRALENLEEAKADLGLDIKARKELAKADGFDTNILGVILKRRKAGEGQTLAADNLLRMYEEALEQQGVLPLERTRSQHTTRRSTEQIANDLHGEDPPENVRPTQTLAGAIGDRLEDAGYKRTGPNSFEAPQP
jgi:uncharacterized protein (UPF0335 family)